jgi:ParB/RepB/Spo0J family partition protein
MAVPLVRRVERVAERAVSTLPQRVIAVQLAAAPREFKDIPLGLIDVPELPSRSTMDDDKLDELTASIRRNGLLQPICVARNGERFEVVAGHRRTLACKRAGLVVVPAVIYPTRHTALEAVKFGENRFREDLNAADEAIYFAELLERDCGGDVDQLCEQLGEKRNYIESRLLLFQGDMAVLDALQQTKITIGVAQQLNKCTSEQYRRYLLHQAIVGGATVAVVSGWILDWKKQEALQLGAPAPASAAPTPGPVPETNYFRCAVCEKTDNVHLMQPINVHQHCRMAILTPMLDAYHGKA